MLDRANAFSEVFKRDLSEIGYTEVKMLITNLNCTGLEFPSIPFMECSWQNTSKGLELILRTYENYITDIEIHDTVANKTLSVNRLKSLLNINDIEIHLMPGDGIDDKFSEYLKKSLIFIRNSKVWSVLNHSSWMDLPFDWQGQK